MFRNIQTAPIFKQLIIMKIRFIKTLFIVSVLMTPFFASAQQNVCSHPVFRQLDFWIGNWRVETPDGKLAGHNRIEGVLDSCVIMENWTGAGSSRGKSLNYYNFQTKKWNQKWIDNYASPLEFEGTIENGVASYTGTSISFQTKKKVFHKLTISKINDDEVHQVWEQSYDEKEWAVVFDGKYIREK